MADKETGIQEFNDEIWAVIERYGQEADLKTATAIGVLEIIKLKLLQSIQEAIDEEEN